MSHLKNVILESFGIETTLDDGKATLSLSGTGDMLAVGPLKQRLKELPAELAAQRVERLDVDIRLLYLMNSSCIKAFVSLVSALQASGRALTIEFVVDKTISGQARVVGPLTRMAPDLVQVSVSPPNRAQYRAKT